MRARTRCALSSDDPLTSAGDRDGGAEPGTVVRRAPFSDNPRVGARGQRTQQRILDAALKVFGDVGYHRTSIDRIAKEAGCSRVSFYQYFSDKIDVFRHLAGQVDRQLNASIDRLDPLTPDREGWDSLRAWVGRYAEIRERYEPVFHAFPAAADSDLMLAGASVRSAGQYVASIRSRVLASPLPPRELDPVVELCQSCLSRTLDDLATLRVVAPAAFPAATVLDAYADMFHRSLFGLQPDVNAHTPRSRRPPKLAFGPIMQRAMDQDASVDAAAAGNGATLTELIDAGRRVFVTRGYHGTRVDDIVAAAGVSHGAFYRYFKNKDELAHLLAAQAMRKVSTTLLEIPTAGDDANGGRTALRRWLRSYNAAQASETAMIRVWADAALDDGELVADSASVLDWGRRRMARFLQGREFGDPETDAVVLLALIDGIGQQERPDRTIDAAVHVIERGFLGR